MLWLGVAAGLVRVPEAHGLEVDAEPTPVNRSQPVAVPEPNPTEAPPGAPDAFSLGGLIRSRYDLRFDGASLSGTAKTVEHYSFDTLGLKATYESDTLFGAAQYRFYGGSFLYGPRNGYVGYPGEVNFPMWAYVGAKLSAQDSVTIGFNQTPFGLVPYFGTSFLETLGFTMGLEEVYNLGVKVAHVEPAFNWQLGFYPRAVPDAFGISRDSARYSTAIVLADRDVPFGTNNAERAMVVGRVEVNLIKDDRATVAVGASLWHADLYNFDTRRTGTKQVEALHLNAAYGSWGLKAIVVRQDLAPRNPLRDDILTIGGYDASYDMAAHGTFVSGEVRYRVPGGLGPFDVVPYLGYSAYYKDRRDFRDTERYILGAAWTLKLDPGLLIYTEGFFGRNDPYIGAGQFLTGLAMGGDNRWKAAFIVNVGYYF